MGILISMSELNSYRPEPIEGSAHGTGKRQPPPRVMAAKERREAESSLWPLCSLWLNSFERKMIGKKVGEEKRIWGKGNCRNSVTQFLFDASPPFSFPHRPLCDSSVPRVPLADRRVRLRPRKNRATTVESRRPPSLKCQSRCHGNGKGRCNVQRQCRDAVVLMVGETATFHEGGGPADAFIAVHAVVAIGVRKNDEVQAEGNGQYEPGNSPETLAKRGPPGC